MNDIFIFIASLLAPLIFYRGLFFGFSSHFKKTKLRAVSGLNFHHPHYGIAFIFVASLILLFSGKNIYTIILLGLGLGLTLDESVSYIFLKTDRAEELEAYRKAFVPTIAVYASLVALLFLLAYLFGVT